VVREEKPPTHNLESLSGFRRTLRRNLTPAEAFLWRHLKGAALDGKKFRRQHGIGPYIVDFYCPECRVIVELDGQVHHNVIAQEREFERDRYLKSLGIQILRFENHVVFEDTEGVLDVIGTAIRRSGTRLL
jgi:very-short-patch-repair endonuclease